MFLSYPQPHLQELYFFIILKVDSLIYSGARGYESQLSLQKDKIRKLTFSLTSPPLHHLIWTLKINLFNKRPFLSEWLIFLLK